MHRVTFVWRQVNDDFGRRREDVVYQNRVYFVIVLDPKFLLLGHQDVHLVENDSVRVRSKVKIEKFKYGLVWGWLN